MRTKSTNGNAIDRDTLVTYLDEYLEAAQGRDYCPNGLQVEGKEQIRRIVLGVSACLELFERAAASLADAVLVHHGLLWQGDPPRITGIHRSRIAALIRNEINLIAYHLPLDRHPEVGNNAMAASALGLGDVEPFGMYEGLSIGFKGLLPDATPLAEMTTRCKAIFEQAPLVFDYGPDLVRSVGIISGAASRSLHDAIHQGLDMFITGEPSEWTMNVAKEAGCHFVAAGHYATERLGIKALGAHLETEFGLEVEFIDIPNPI